MKEEPLAQPFWPIDGPALKALLRYFSAPILVVGFLVAALLSVIAVFAIGWILADFMSADQKRASDAAKAALPILAAAIGFPLLIWRLLILDRQTRISEEKTQIDREAHFTSIFSRSVDQLGQTRELKSTSRNGGTTETVTKTIPNIEVRLGGIHSLVRLAEESRRDREKIQSTLLAYVRENSWLDRDGEKTLSSMDALPRINDWSLAYRRGTATKEHEKSLSDWKSKIAIGLEQRKAWAASTKETRVDVNEAIDAVNMIGPFTVETRVHRFFESLFVGCHFTKDHLINSRFERCVMVNCSFSIDTVSKLDFYKNEIYDCTFSFDSIAVKFSHCILFSPYFDIASCNITLDDCQTYEMSTYHNGKENTFNFRGGYIYGDVFDSGTLLVKARRTIFVECNFDDVQFKEESQFEMCGLPGSSFNGSDLSHAQISNATTLITAKGNSKTRLPPSVPRPPKWPAPAE